MQIFTLPRFVTVDGSGAPYSGAKLEFYRAGTSTPENTYSDVDLMTPNANPVVADSNGLFGPIFLGTSYNYKAVLKTAADVTIWTQDDIPGGAIDGGKLATGSVPTAALANESVTLAKMADLAEGSILVGGASDRPVALALEAGQVPVGNGTGVIAAGVPLPRGYRSGCEVTIGTDSDHDIDIAEGVVRDSTDTVNIDVSAITKQLDTTFAEGTDAGGMNDDAAIANNTTYYIFAIAKTDGTADVYADTSAVAANLPSGFTYFAEITLLCTDGSANIKDILGQQQDAPVTLLEQTGSGSETELDFTIPSWAKRVTVMFMGLTRNAGTEVIVQLGGAGGINSSDYNVARARSSASGIGTAGFTNGFQACSSADATGNELHGPMTITLGNTNVWVASSNIASSGALSTSGGSLNLAEQLTKIRVTTANGTATLTGSVSVMCE